MVEHLQPVTPQPEIVRPGVASFDQEIVILAAPSRPPERGDDVGSVEPHREHMGWAAAIGPSMPRANVAVCA
jgi:hypothetical protein